MSFLERIGLCIVTSVLSLPADWIERESLEARVPPAGRFIRQSRIQSSYTGIPF